MSVIAFLCMGWLFPGQACAEDQGVLVQAAREQVGKTRIYDPAYEVLAYPNGDVPLERGVCTDVVIRALRNGYQLDLQKLVHEDMVGNFAGYPRDWGMKKPDRNIDHRRVKNLQTYFQRRGWGLPVSRIAENYQPGDVVTCLVPPNRPHIMIVSNKRASSGRFLVIHNIGAGAQEEDYLFGCELTGHYRVTR